MSDLKIAEGLAQTIGKHFLFKIDADFFFILGSLISCLDENTTVLNEFKKGYKQAKKLLNENSENVVLIADALMKFKTLGKCIFNVD